MDVNQEKTSRFNGKIVEGYRIEEKIWHGATSTVYRCTDASGNGRHGQVTALKVLHPYRREPHQLRMFVKEARLQQRLEHRNIVKVHSYGSIDDSLYILMEYVAGKNLRGFSQNGVPPEKEYFMMFRDMADAIGFIHSRGIIHNDIKPENMLYDPEINSFKLIDFGYARPLRRFFGRKCPSGGTEKYLAPERSRGIYNERSDIYSFGIVMEEFLLEKVKNRIVESIVYKSTRQDPGSRYSSFSEMISDMKYYLYQQT